MTFSARLSLRAVLALHALVAAGLSAALALVLVLPAVRSAALGQRAADAAALAASIADRAERSCARSPDRPSCFVAVAESLSGSDLAVRAGPAPGPPGSGVVRGVSPLSEGSFLVVELAARPAQQRAGRIATLAALFATVEAVALFLFLYSVLARLVARPADQLLAGLERVGRGADDSELSGDAPSLGRIGAAFEGMEKRLGAERRRVEEQLDELRTVNRKLSEARETVVRQEKLATVGRLSAGVAHEIGNPLAAILGYLEVLRARSTQDSQLGEYVERMERETRRIDRIVRDLLDFARPAGGRAGEPVALAELLDHTVRLVSTQKRFARIRIETDADARLPKVRGEEHYLQQVLLNLLVNAADAMGGQGTIHVTAALSENTYPGRRAGDAPPGPRVALTVRDEGPGIPAADLPRLFDPFFTTKAPGEGTGLGLSICHSLVESFGGTISARNAEEGGAELRVELPVVSAASSASMAS